MAYRIKSMGTSTMKFNEGVIVSGSSAHPNNTQSDYALVVSGSQYIDAAGSHGLTIFKEESDHAFIRFVNSNDPSSWYAYIGMNSGEDLYIAPGRSQDFFLQMRTGVAEDPITFPFRIHDDGKAKFEHGQSDSAGANSNLAEDVVFSVSGSLDGTRNTVFTGHVQMSGSLNIDQQLLTKAFVVNVRDVGANDGIEETDYFIRCIQSQNITITLPPKNVNVGRVLIFKDALGNAGHNNRKITIATDGSDTIDGAATYVIGTIEESITLTCDGINGWMITSRVRP